MICPQCESEYREGIARCSDCDVALLHSLDDVPRESLEPLYETQSAEFLAMLADRLEKASIPYVIEAGTALRLLDDIEEMTTPDPWRARVYVGGAFDRNAQAIVESLELELGQQRLTWPAYDS